MGGGGGADYQGEEMKASRSSRALGHCRAVASRAGFGGFAGSGCGVSACWVGGGFLGLGGGVRVLGNGGGGGGGGGCIGFLGFPKAQF